MTISDLARKTAAVAAVNPYRAPEVIAAAIREAVNDALERAAQEIECERAAGDSYEAKRINADIAGHALAIRNLKAP